MFGGGSLQMGCGLNMGREILILFLPKASLPK